MLNLNIFKIVFLKKIKNKIVFLNTSKKHFANIQFGPNNNKI